MQKITSAFFARDTVIVAQELVGKIISKDGFLARIVETEAYKKDPASHAFTRTERSALMYDTYSHIYVYLIYGVHYCLNFTTEKDDAGAVLIRAVQPLNKIDDLKKRRSTDSIKNLCNGPGKLCQALQITKKDNGQPVGKSIAVFDDDF